ncbi:hypothetical protein JQX13_14800 [Archangium violaceum]|uniref:hypothetical protein n=1 Tax=Archangium violaceum TaxID=83451 RepID=UPI00193B06CB|nr:hypothetical protein [Archangium violaceum]QRK11226.1 hypothetical protein JQX13_14800 [Archangium violaceum]
MGVMLRCAFFLLLVGGPALAGPRPESRWGLRWNGAPGCIQAAPLARAVEARLGRPVFGPEPGFLIDGVLERGGPSGWKARLSLVDARGNVLGSREVSTPEAACTAIEPRLLLVIAVMIDPSAAFARPAPASPPEPERAPEPERPQEPMASEPPPPSAPAVPRVAPPPETARSRIQPGPPAPRGSGTVLTAAATGSVGGGFGVAPGISGTAWFSPGGWPWLLRLALAPYAGYEKDGGRLALVTSVAEGGVCPVSWADGAWSASGCATATFSLVFAYSVGFEQGRLEPIIRGDLGPRARLERRLGERTALHVGLGAGFGWLRPTVRLLKPDGTAEDLRLGLPVQVTLDVGVSFLGPWGGMG